MNKTFEKEFWSEKKKMKLKKDLFLVKFEFEFEKFNLKENSSHPEVAEVNNSSIN